MLLFYFIQFTKILNIGIYNLTNILKTHILIKIHHTANFKNSTKIATLIQAQDKRSGVWIFILFWQVCLWAFALA